MKPVMQQVLNDERGDCYSACLASIFEMPLDSVPNFHEIAGIDPDLWDKAIRGWLNKRGYELVIFHFDMSSGKEHIPKVYHIMSVEDPKNKSYHSVVAFGGTPVHDPHPKGGVEPFKKRYLDEQGNARSGETSFELFVPISPAEFIHKKTKAE